MKLTTKMFVGILVLFAALWLDVSYILHLQKVIADRVIYEDAGCRGWYQGTE
jgi:hypothetical protein